MPDTTQENLMYRYLLGDLPEAEQSALETEYFADSEKLEQMWAAENDLVDSYVRDQLPRADRESFERHYLQSPRHRQRVTLARKLLAEIDEEYGQTVGSEAATQPRNSWWTGLLELLRGPQLLLGGALAAAMLLLALGGLWFLNERTRLVGELAQSRAQSDARAQRESELAQRARDLEAQITAQQGQNEQLAAELEKLRVEQRRLADAKDRQQIAQAIIPFFSLAEGSVRSGGDVQQLTLPQKAAQVRLQMKAEAAEYARYAVVIKAVGGDEVWRRTPVSGARAGNNAVVTVSVPAAPLVNGDYILTLSGLTAAGDTEEITRYFFRISRR